MLTILREINHDSRWLYLALPQVANYFGSPRDSLAEIQLISATTTKKEKISLKKKTLRTIVKWHQWNTLSLHHLLCFLAWEGLLLQLCSVPMNHTEGKACQQNAMASECEAWLRGNQTAQWLAQVLGECKPSINTDFFSLIKKSHNKKLKKKK